MNPSDKTEITLYDQIKRISGLLESNYFKDMLMAFSGQVSTHKLQFMHNEGKIGTIFQSFGS